MRGRIVAKMILAAFEVLHVKQWPFGLMHVAVNLIIPLISHIRTFMVMNNGKFYVKQISIPHVSHIANVPGRSGSHINNLD